MAGVGVAQIVGPKISDACLSASRSEASLYVPHVPAIPIAEHIACLFRHLREDFMEGVVDREQSHGVVLGYGQDDEAILKPNEIPLQPQYFTPTHAGC